MRPLVVVEVELLHQALIQLDPAFSWVDVDVFDFDAPPEPLDEGIVGRVSVALPSDRWRRRYCGGGGGRQTLGWRCDARHAKDGSLDGA
jgi:hypothetical protein